MKKKLLQSYFKKIIPLANVDANTICSYFKQKSVKKRGILT